MSGPLSTLTARFHRASARRLEARLKKKWREKIGAAAFTGLRARPEASEFGDFTRARAALQGELVLGAERLPLSALTPWDLELSALRHVRTLHGFDWLDDMAGLSGKQARARAQGWSLGWLDRYGEGTGPGWAPEVTGPRLKRLLWHLEFLEKGLPEAGTDRLRLALAEHTKVLAEDWEKAEGEAARLAALSGLIHGAASLEGFEAARKTARDGLGALLKGGIAETGASADRNPEALLDVLLELLQIRDLCAVTGDTLPAEVDTAIEAIAPTLRLLRHGDGSLARFHGGGSGGEGRLDRALAASGVRGRPGQGPAMGYIRLTGRRTQVIADCARPADQRASAHASTLGFEVSSGREQSAITWVRRPVRRI
ncbi:MAG: heparinase II/III family protein [Pseudomonadota bacterium]